ncbi:winged helix-turn-helix domain-containing protein [Streptomyces griseorubiginosus]|uniref:winged helix-turn-helix domain-containing protein n=1 Tax=Streptomyces griseorubiginosus TaxID=67304 RepID=UPI0027E24C0E|nr:helix-turn-helix domain-containing protein [Streptomyces griseorubiginosus]MBO4252554.1 helix-turn-helix domain-containing protein [Streptomyces griseorubiginosus]
MTEEDANAAPPNEAAADPRDADGRMPEHRVRMALLDLLAEVGTVTATEAAGRLGYSSGLCSFHLRQLARYGHIEEVPHSGGRARPWRLRQTAPPATNASAEGFGHMARGLEDESYQRWLAQRDHAPAEWRQDEAFSAVVYLSPEEMSTVAAAVRQALAPYQHREQQTSARPASAQPVALIARLFPLLPERADE